MKTFGTVCSGTFRNKPAADGPRYKALGNSMAVPCIRWICARMDLVDELAPLTENELEQL
jgi:hypothetical protein